MNAGQYPDEPRRPRLEKLQDRVLDLVARSGDHGLTQKELSNHLSIGHGSASGALTRLHRADKVVRLAEKRVGQQPYVLPDLAGERRTAPYTPHKGTGNQITIPAAEVRRISYVMGSDPSRADSYLTQFLLSHGVHVEAP